MFRITSLQKYEGEIQTLTFDYNPLMRPFGIHTDINGGKWDCNGMCGGHLLARPYETDYFTDTSNTQYDGVQHGRWIPYKVEIKE
jgi:hypothetical protein